MGIDASFLRAPVRLSGIRINQDLDMHDTVTPAILHRIKTRYIDAATYIPPPPPPAPWLDPFTFAVPPSCWVNIFPPYAPWTVYGPNAWYVVGDPANFAGGYVGPFYGLLITGAGTPGKQYLVQAGYDFCHVHPYPPFGPYQWFDLYAGGTPQAGAFKFHIRDNRGILPEVVKDLQSDPYFNAYPPATRVWIPPAYQALLDTVPWICYFEVDITATTDLKIAVFDANYP